MDQPRFYTGQLLLAFPGIGDPRFDRAVIAMCSHDENGALGIGIGHALPHLRLHDVMKQVDIDPGQAPNAAVHTGGPVEQKRGFVLHSLDWGGNDSLQVADRWALTGTLEVLRALAEGRGPTRWLVAMGYAGWGAGQLDGEMTRHGWHVVPGSDPLLYDTPVESRWAEAYRASGIDPAMLTGVSGSA